VVQGNEEQNEEVLQQRKHMEYKSIEDYAAAIAMIRNLTTLTKIQGGVLLG
jgi:hypothetical protein